MAVAAWVIIEFLVNTAVSSAKSTSLIRESEDERFSEVVVKLAMVRVTRDWIAPSSDLMVLT